MSTEFDPRITPAKPDVADWAFRDKIHARRYVHPTPYQVIRDGAPLCFTANLHARQESQLLFGEIFNVYERTGDWCWGQNMTDGYVGYVARINLTREIEEPSHVVHSLRTFCYRNPDLKDPVDRTISFGSRVRVGEEENGYSRIRGGDWIYSKHLMPIDIRVFDYVTTALTFIGQPYLWGGRSSQGVDCSALLQLALMRAGIQAPRDSDLQEKALGYPVDQAGDLSDIQEGDIIFFPGHAGIVVDNWRFLHANAFDMLVTIHGLSEVLDRAKAAGAPYTTVRRIDEYEHALPEATRAAV